MHKIKTGVDDTDHEKEKKNKTSEQSIIAVVTMESVRPR